MLRENQPRVPFSGFSAAVGRSHDWGLHGAGAGAGGTAAVGRARGRKDGRTDAESSRRTKRRSRSADGRRRSDGQSERWRRSRRRRGDIARRRGEAPRHNASPTERHSANYDESGFFFTTPPPTLPTSLQKVRTRFTRQQQQQRTSRQAFTSMVAISASHIRNTSAPLHI